jgi:hypothetical protein
LSPTLSYETHGKGRIGENCLVKRLCRALFVGTHGKGFAVRAYRRTAKKIQIQLKIVVN